MTKKKILTLVLLAGTGLTIASNAYAKEDSVSITATSEKKYVTLYFHYDNINYHDIGDYWYSDGVYSGWLYKREAKITGSFTAGYDVTYRGWVWKGPFVPNKINPEKMK